MSDKLPLKRKSYFGRKGFVFLSVAVGASAIGAYFLSSEKRINPVRKYICERLGCSCVCGDWDPSWDRHATSKFTADNFETAGSKKRLVTRNLIFVRHGQYHDKFKSDEERMLTSKGRQQATWTGKRLREMGLKFDIIVHSTMRRAVETADLIIKELDIENSSKEISLSETDLLREGHPIVPIPYKGKSITDKDGERIEKAFANFFHRPPPTQNNDSYELYVCHANVIRYLALRALQLAPTAWLRLSLCHASITWVSIRSDGYVSLRRMGDAGHIPFELESR